MATAICASISLLFVKFCRGKRPSYAEKLKLAISSIRNHMFSEFIFCDDAKLNEIEENIWIA
ncbi:hypothetical protein DMI70_13425 [Escherichia coli]|nr:hypothetical protein [Escherichia coli]